MVDQEELQEEGKGVKNEESEVLEKDKKVRGPNCMLYVLWKGKGVHAWSSDACVCVD